MAKWRPTRACCLKNQAPSFAFGQPMMPTVPFRQVLLVAVISMRCTQIWGPIGPKKVPKRSCSSDLNLSTGFPGAPSPINSPQCPSSPQAGWDAWVHAWDGYGIGIPPFLAIFEFQKGTRCWWCFKPVGFSVSNIFETTKWSATWLRPLRTAKFLDRVAFKPWDRAMRFSWEERWERVRKKNPSFPAESKLRCCQN